MVVWVGGGAGCIRVGILWRKIQAFLGIGCNTINLVFNSNHAKSFSTLIHLNPDKFKIRINETPL